MNYITSHNWQTKKLGEICDIYQSKTISAKEMVSDGEYVVFGANGIIGHYDKYNHEESQLLITCRGATCGSVNISEPKSWITGNAMVVRPKNTSLDLKYLEYIFRGGLNISKVITGAAQPQITRTNLEPVEISYPKSLPEQIRIVKVLDEVFEKTAKAKENAERNLKNAKELFESYLQRVFSSEKWEEKQVDEICEVEYGYTEKAKSKGDYRFVRITDTDESGLLTQEKKMYIDSFDEARKYTLTDGDLLMARTGASAGNLLLFEGDEKAVFASYLIRMKFKKEILSKLYWYFSKSKLYWDQVGQLSAGSAQPQFNGGALKQIIFPFPKSLSEQKSIVKKLDALSGETKKLELIYKQKLVDLEELKKSVLKSAFAGKY